MKKDDRRLRLIIRLTCFVAALGILWPVRPPLSHGGLELFFHISPFVTVCSGIAGSVIGIGFVVGLLARSSKLR